MKSVLITGVSSGIGLSLAGQYLNDGHRVFGISRRGSPLAGTAPRFSEIRFDLTNTDGLGQAVRELLESLREKRNTPGMPIPDEIAGRLSKLFERASSLIPSGGFLDIRAVVD